jgi:Ulp1 family protease
MSATPGWTLVPDEPTEAMIQAACLRQSDDVFETYEAWCNSHSSGIVERIRRYLVEDYKIMVAMAPRCSHERT